MGYKRIDCLYRKAQLDSCKKVEALVELGKIEEEDICNILSFAIDEAILKCRVRCISLGIITGLFIAWIIVNV